MVADWEMERNRAETVFTKNLGNLKGELCSNKLVFPAFVDYLVKSIRISVICSPSVTGFPFYFIFRFYWLYRNAYSYLPESQFITLISNVI